MADADKSESRKQGFFADLFQTRYREVTISSILFGLLFGVVLNASITYAGLKIGFTIVGSALAAVVGFGVLRGMLRKGSILEVNLGQTIASAVNSATPGIIFTVPVLYLMYGLDGMEPWSPRFWLVTLAGIVGGILGVAFIVPLRKQMIDVDRLRFPQGTAVGAILKSPGAGPKKALVLLGGAIVGAGIYLGVELPNVYRAFAAEKDKKAEIGYFFTQVRLPGGQTDPIERLPRDVDRNADSRPDMLVSGGSVDVGRFLRMLGKQIGLPQSLWFPEYVLFVLAITPLSFGAGYLTGKPGLMVLAGGILAFWILNPIAYSQGWMPATMHPDAVPGFARGQFNRPLGIGMLLGGALMGVVAALPAIRAAMGSIILAGVTKRGTDELNFPILVGAAVLGIVGLFLAFGAITAGQESTGVLAEFNPALRNLLIALIGAAWIWFAGIIIAQCTGMTDWSPVSGIALLTVVLVMWLSGTDLVIAAVLIGAALCVAIACSADMMADLKTGYLVGAKPRRQQTIELVAVCVGPLVTMITLMLIAQANTNNYGVAMGDGTPTTAPQAKALQSVIAGVQGQDMPYALYGTGILLGALLGMGAFPGLGVLVGLSMYLPLEYVLTYGLGCIANMFAGRIKGRAWAEEWGVPFCAGLIVGEALLAIFANMVIVVKGWAG